MQPHGTYKSKSPPKPLVKSGKSRDPSFRYTPPISKRPLNKPPPPKTRKPKPGQLDLGNYIKKASEDSNQGGSPKYSKHHSSPSNAKQNKTRKPPLSPRSHPHLFR